MDTHQEDPVLAQLKKLREGRGLTEGRLQAAGAVLSALGTSDPLEGMRSLTQAIAALGDGDKPRALAVDFGLDLADHLEREVSPRERDRLGERRSGYGSVVARDVKTLARWSDAALRDLRASLISDTFTGHLYVIAAVEGDRILGISLIEEDLGQDGGVVDRRSTELPNPSRGPSIPALIYALPRDWRPASLRMAVVFKGRARPQVVQASVSSTLLNVSFGEERYSVPVDGDGTAACRFERPGRWSVYSLSWERQAERSKQQTPASS